MKNEEKEIKVKLPRSIFKKIELNVASFSNYLGEKRQKDEYFDNSNFYITNLNRGLRIRTCSLRSQNLDSSLCSELRWNNKDPKVLEFKSLFYNPCAPKYNPWYIEEIILPFPLKTREIKTLIDILVRLEFKKITPTKMSCLDYNLTKKFLKRYSLEPRIIVSKTRREYQYQNSTITFDEVEKLGCFLEIESEASSINLFRELGIKDLKVVRTGYNDMLAEGISNFVSNKERQKRFLNNPCWNILKSEREIVEKMLKTITP